MSKRDLFGTEPLGKLLKTQAIPASIGILVMSIYGIVDTIFVGRWVGAMGIGAITVVMPITFLIASIGMSIGVGGASIISRAFGEKNDGKAYQTFGNQVGLTLTLALFLVFLGFIFKSEILNLFGGKGEILAPAGDYFEILLFGVPFLAWAMMSNNVIRAEGYPKYAMLTLIVPAVSNIILDPIFIVGFNMGIKGAAWATTISYIASAFYTTWFFLKGESQMKLNRQYLQPSLPIVKEIASIGSITLARQGTISILSIVLNNSLFFYGGEIALSAYGVINRVMLFANFPVLGITQGFVPIVGYNYGAKLFSRVQKIIFLSIRTASFVALCIFATIMSLTPQIVGVFTEDPALLEMTVPALRLSYLATPLLAVSLLGSAYFQAIGKVLPALLLTLSKQGFFLIPLVLILPLVFGLNGVWISFPIADVGAALITFWYLRKEMGKMKKEAEKSISSEVDKSSSQVV